MQYYKSINWILISMYKYNKGMQETIEKKI